MKTVMVLGTVLSLATPAFADEGEDTLRFFLAKSDLVILGKIASAPNRASEEVGGVYYSCDFQIAEVLKGQKPAEDTIRVTIARFEREEADRLPELKQGSKCILFLKNAGDGKRVAWRTADVWFGVQRPSPAMARSLRQLAGGEKEGQAAEGPKLVAAGEWSKPVVDSRGAAVRGRLALYEKPRSDDRREVIVYVEVQDASEARGRSLQLFGDFGKTDFRPEYKGGLDCQLRDKDGRPIPSTPFAFSGGVPASQWITLPSDATIRLRATPFGIHRAKALAISPHLGNLWVIGDDDPREYFLSGTFTVDPAADRTPPGGEHVWRGAIILPPRGS